MFTRKIAVGFSLLAAVFIFQESVMNQFRLPGSGFSVFLILVFTWSSISTPEIALLTGFSAGILLDLAQGSDGPIGQWTLILVLVCYGVSYFGEGNINGNPLGIVFFVVSANFVAHILFRASGALLGVQVGSLGQVLLTLFGTSVWTLAITPILLPVFSKAHEIIFDSRTSL